MAADRYLLFVWKPTGYELQEREGEPPAVGSQVELGEELQLQTVSKVGPSPLPGDSRLCAYLHG